MFDSSFFTRLKTGRFFRVLAIYLGVSWVIIQVVGELRVALRLPSWISPVTIILLAVGLVVILATAWVQSHPLVDRREEADEVPDSWEMALDEAREAISAGRLPHLTWARALAAGAVAFLLFFGLAGLYVVIQDRGEHFAPEDAVADPAGPGLAVLPFGVNTAELDEWSEGMVDVLGINLDGTAGLRAIDSRTVLARWSEVVGEGGEGDLEQSLEVARRSGARYALIGDVVGLGSDLRLSAEVYDVETGERLGSSSVEGSRDDVFGLVDHLSIEIVRGIVGGDVEDLPDVDLARVTTSSLPALKAYLEGEILLRHTRFDQAVAAYRRAVEQDSTFALAWYRLSLSRGWLGNHEIAQNATARALEQVDRLPPRQATLIRARSGYVRGELWTTDTLEQAVRRYPDDADAWYYLGEMYWHFGPQTLDRPADAERAFARAVDIDPRFGPAYIHRINLALVDADSARSAGIIDTLSLLETDPDQVAGLRVAHRIAFGDSTTAARAQATLDSITPDQHILRYWNPRLLERKEPIVRARRARDSGGGNLFYNFFQRGKIEAALEALDHPSVTSRFRKMMVAALVLHRPFPVPDSLAERALAPSVAIDTTDVTDLFVDGTLAARSGEPDRLRRATEGLERIAADHRDRGETARQPSALIDALEGYAAWQRGEPERAAELLEQARFHISGTYFSWMIRWWLAEISRELDRLDEATRYYASHWNGVYALERLGRLYEETDEIEKAHQAYGLVLAAWEDADPVLRDRIEHARRYVEGSRPVRER